MGFARHGVERTIQTPHELSFGRVIAVVRGVHTHVMPERFDRVELRAVLGQRTQVKAMTVAPQPLSHLGSPVVGRVVVDQEDFLLPVALRQPVEKGRVAATFKDVATPVVEARPVQVEGAKDLLRVPLARRRDQRLVSAACPRLVEARVLTETGFIGEQQGGVVLRGFFLAGGRCSAASGLARSDRPSPVGVADAGPKTPSL